MKNGVNHARPAGQMPLTWKTAGLSVSMIMLRLAAQYLRKVASALVHPRLSRQLTSSTEVERLLINSEDWVLMGEVTARHDAHESLDGERIEFPVPEPSKYRTALYAARTMYAIAGPSEPARLGDDAGILARPSAPGALRIQSNRRCRPESFGRARPRPWSPPRPEPESVRSAPVE